VAESSKQEEEEEQVKKRYRKIKTGKNNWKTSCTTSRGGKEVHNGINLC